MKKSFLSVLAAALLAFSFSAQAVEVTGTLGAASNYVFRGVSESDKATSFNAGVKATAGGLFAEAVTNTLSDRSDLATTATAGYTTSIAGVQLTGGYNHYLYTGNAKQSSNQNFGEVFGAASFKGLNGYVAQTVDRANVSGRNTYTRIGYTAPTFYGFTADVGTAYTHYRNEGVTQHTNTEASLSYNVLKNVKVVAAYSKGGLNAKGQRLANQTTFSANVGF
jgi:uncharacterized protein (TIGR02001 family)